MKTTSFIYKEKKSVAVHRYKANESSEDDKVVKTNKVSAKKTVKPTKKEVVVATKKTTKIVKSKKVRKPLRVLAPFRAMGGYFVGSWKELRQVRWPNRKQTWALTLAVILFSLALGVLIFLLDAGFTLLFKNVIF